MANGVKIKQDMYVWAITRAGWSVEDFSKKHPKVLDWIEERKTPTLKQVEAFSKTVHLPMGYLFLPEPIKESVPFPFFRTNNTPTTNVSLNVYDTIVILQRRQEWLKTYLTEHQYEPLPFVGKFTPDTPYKTIAADIRNILGFDLNWASEFKNWEDTLNHLTNRIEELGIITVFNGVVDNNPFRSISVSECRGFIMVDHIAPFLFINNSDAKAAQLFTIMHELAHVWLGQSAGFNNETLLPSNDPLEKLCDSIAAEFLVPEVSLESFWKEHPSTIQASRYFKVSEIVIARRVYDLGIWNRNQFLTFYREYSAREFAKRENAGGGGDFYATAKKRVSLAFAAHVQRAVKTGELLYRDAYKLTSMKGNTYDTFFKTYF